MAHYTKEKNIISIYAENGRVYTVDINTAMLTGARGTQLKTCPKNAIYKALPYNCWTGRYSSASYLEVMLYEFISNYHTSGNYIENFATILSVADRLDSLKLPAHQYLHTSEMLYLKDCVREYAEWVRQNLNEDGDLPMFGAFEGFMSAKKALQKFGACINEVPAEVVRAILNNRPNITVEEMRIAIYYLTYGKMWEYSRHNAVRDICEYFDMCHAMEVQPRKTNNFVREYVETKRTYQAKKTEYDNKQIVANYAKHAKAWEFTFGDFTVVIPTTGQDIVDEGAKMHHCVGGYVNRVVENSTYICFVRRTDSTDTPYITCQVCTDGTIGQYYLAYDKCISTEADFAFKRAFQAHLNKVWG